MSVERLTKKKLGSSYPLKNDASAKVGLFTDYDGFYAFFEAVNRLGEIEDILGDDYDISRLRELVEADRDGRCVVHGEWLCAETDDEQFFLCSVCNKKEYWESNYCPNCGAKMDEEQEETANEKRHDT